MHQDVEHLIALAKSAGFVTKRQCEMILSKARDVGDDIVEVEFYLSDIPIREETASFGAPQPVIHPISQTPNSLPTKPTKKGNWIWIVVITLAALVTIVVIASVVSYNSSSINNSSSIYNFINHTNWDDELTRYDKGMTMLLNEMTTGDIDEVASRYMWLADLYNDIENAQKTGQLTSEQQVRYAQIQEKHLYMGISTGAMYLINQIFNQ